jgi:hypothetical protein
MPYTPKCFLGPVLLANASALLYTVPANQKLRIDDFKLRNTDNTTVYLATLHVIPAAGTADETNMAMELQPIDPTKVYPAIDEMVGRWLESGTMIYGHADTASKISVVASGLLKT